MYYAALKTLHLLCVIVWLGGMAFAHFFLRPALTELAVPERLRLMHAVLGRFFRAVLVAIGLILASGAAMVEYVAAPMVQAGGDISLPLEWLVMALLGLLMMAIFGHIRFVLYRRFSQALAAARWPDAGAALGRIRFWVVLNLVLGGVIVVVTVLGSSV